MKNRFNLDSVHSKGILFFFDFVKSLKFTDENIKKRAIELLKYYMEREEDKGERPVVVCQPVPKPTVPKGSRFQEFRDDPDDCVHEKTSELDAYLAYHLPDEQQNDGILPKQTFSIRGIFSEFLENFDLLTFWRDATQFPVLRKVAQWVL